MAKKRAFVKYTKKGKIIPGSLIVTTSGGHPVDGVYKEVPEDLCCGGGGDCTPLEAIGVAEITQEDLFSTTYNGLSVILTCRNIIPEYNFSATTFINNITLPIYTLTTWEDVVNVLNTNFAAIGTFSYLGGTSVQLITNTEYIPCVDPEVTIEFNTP